MPKSITIFNPEGTEHFTEGSGDIAHINVHFYFANVVMIVIIYSDTSKVLYYQIPCIVTESP